MTEPKRVAFIPKGQVPSVSFSNNNKICYFFHFWSKINFSAKNNILILNIYKFSAKVIQKFQKVPKKVNTKGEFYPTSYSLWLFLRSNKFEILYFNVSVLSLMEVIVKADKAQTPHEMVRIYDEPLLKA